MLHDKDKHTSKCCPFLACCVLQFFLLTIYKPLLYNIDELQKWWSCYLISVKCTRAVCLFMRYSVISVKCINVCAGQITIWHTISLYTGIPVLLSCADSVKNKKKVVQSNPNVSHFIDSINNGPIQKKNWKWLLTTAHYETNDENVPWCTPQQNRMLSLSSCICKSGMRQLFRRPWKQNAGSVSVALLLLGPCINRQSSGTLAMTQRLGFLSKEMFL